MNLRELTVNENLISCNPSIKKGRTGMMLGRDIRPQGPIQRLAQTLAIDGLL